MAAQGWMFAAGELAMTPHDLALWDESILARSILSSESYKKMFTEVKLKDGNGTHYGLGVEVTERNGLRSIEHSGEVNGFVSDNEVLIDNGVAVAVTTNHMGGGAEEIAQLRGRSCGRQSQGTARGGAGARNLQCPAEGRDRPEPAGAQPERLLFGADSRRFQEQPRAVGRSADLSHDTRILARRHDVSRFRDRVSGKKLRLTTYTYPDGKLEQYLVEPAD
jgi:D-alanyl-D-alanine carboxypeptidase